MSDNLPAAPGDGGPGDGGPGDSPPAGGSPAGEPAAQRLRRIWLSGGPPLWVASAALLISVVALIVAGASAGDDRPVVYGAGPSAGPTIPVAEPTDDGDDTDGSGATASGPAPGGTAATGGTATPTATGSAAAVAAGPVTCPAATVTVSDAKSLQQALDQARPGTVIKMQDGVYPDRFTATTPGTADRPVFLCGGPGAVIDAGGVDGGYAFHLDGASHWRLIGFTVRNGQKGVMADGVQGTVIQGLTVEDIGDEGIHLRDFSSGNVVEGNTVRATGKRKEQFGEGVYVGSAQSNWCTVTGCKPDKSDDNVIRGNHISDTTAESVDIKEGTTGGSLTGNTFDGAGLSGGHNDSWVDVKGNDWLIKGNVGRHSREDGFQTHRILDGWGTGNVFQANTAQVDGPGYGFHFAPPENNKVTCDNKVADAAKGLANIACAS
ncbi:right-handed parallel beta-helix repeat-containing protein [Streptomyces shenzhenensis]|uniref:right-handed parallel beta-helix repeat-containing protein n=1 Tax=Streptomyces shenzhenensis TaxID=943815 RepID=UPI001F281C6B|nr:right-handed parallel beta-helix repeat-containing protein [Streptomyces shenzhenensis]